MCVPHLTRGDREGKGTGGDRLLDFQRHGAGLLCSALRPQGVGLGAPVCGGETGAVGALHLVTSGCQLVQMF